MTPDEDDIFGAGPPPEAQIIPFPRMRPSSALRKKWGEALAKWNTDKRTRHQLLSPLDIVPSMMERRKMPPMPWPAGWPNLAQRMKTFAGDTVTVVGAIGGGKTSFAIQVALACAAAGHPVLWMPAELDPEQINSRVIANMNGVHASEVFEHWPQKDIETALTSCHDMWRYVDRHYDLDMQKAAIKDAVALAWEVFGVPPLLVVDHLGELVGDARDERQAILSLGQWLRILGKETLSFIMPLAQSSVANQSVLTGKVDLDAASDAMNIFVGGKAMAQVSSSCIGLALFKEDDKQILDAHGLVIKARHTGREGKVGLRFNKPGGVWTELDHLPATPGETKAEEEKGKKASKGPGPTPTSQEVREMLNTNRASDAASLRRHRILTAIRSYGALGIEEHQIRKLLDVGKGAALMQAIQELVRTGLVERIPGNKYRAITRIE